MQTHCCVSSNFFRAELLLGRRSTSSFKGGKLNEGKSEIAHSAEFPRIFSARNYHWEGDQHQALEEGSLTKGRVKLRTASLLRLLLLHVIIN